MEAGGVGEVIASESARFKVGDIVVGRTGWASHAVMPDAEIRAVDPDLAPLSTAVGILGMPGHTAWVGLNDILQAKEGETIVVSAATGAVGGVVGQLARRKGLQVIGVAGGAEKCAYAVNHLGFGACLDHRDPNLAAELAALTPDGVDCYYENVGGATLEAVLPRMNVFGRIAVCGMIAWYSGKGVEEAMRISRLGNSSITYDIGLFRNEDKLAAAQGHFTHVNVARADKNPVAITAQARAAFADLV